VSDTSRVWVNDIALGGQSWTDQTEEHAFTHFFIGTGNHASAAGSGEVYWDDVKVWVGD
jgi:hypothetical protein